MLEELERRFEGGGLFDAGRGPVRIARDDHVAPVRAGAADRLEGLAAHQDRAADGHSLEMLEVFGKVPGHVVAVADDTVAGDRGDDGQQRIFERC